MKRFPFIFSFILFIFLFSSCKNNDSSISEINTNNTINPLPHKLEEYFETYDFDNYGYEWINCIRAFSDEMYITGGKTLSSSKRCLIVSENIENYESISLNFDYSSIKDA